jgi:uncharacterized protein with HEPN domain
MSPRSWQARIDDMLLCAKNILDFTEGMSLEEFLVDARTVRAVAFELTTIGEATRAIPDDIQKQTPDIPWGKMLGIRNVLVHEYFRLDEEMLWKTARVDIPILIDGLNKLKE